MHPAGWDAIEREYRGVIRQPLEFAAIARAAKRLVLDTGLSAGVRHLVRRLAPLVGPQSAAAGDVAGRAGRRSRR